MHQFSFASSVLMSEYIGKVFYSINLLCKLRTIAACDLP